MGLTPASRATSLSVVRPLERRLVSALGACCAGGGAGVLRIDSGADWGVGLACDEEGGKGFPEDVRRV